MSVTSVNRSRDERFMASFALFKKFNLIFMKFFGLSVGTSLLIGLNNPKLAMSRTMAVALYSEECSSHSVLILEQVLLEHVAVKMTENDLMLMLCTSSGCSVIIDKTGTLNLTTIFKMSGPWFSYPTHLHYHYMGNLILVLAVQIILPVQDRVHSFCVLKCTNASPIS